MITNTWNFKIAIKYAVVSSDKEMHIIGLIQKVG
jgi:hypothetical protein